MKCFSDTSSSIAIQDDLFALPKNTVLLAKYWRDGDANFPPGYYKAKLVFKDGDVGMLFKARYNSIPGQPRGIAFGSFE